MLNIKHLALGDYQTNCYILYEDASTTCAIIDPGYEPDRVLSAVAQLNLSVEAILLTHGHFDHVGGVKAIAEKTGCTVYLCEEDLNLPSYMTAGALYYTDGYDEGDNVHAAGLTFQVLHTPGHTPGSVCLMVQSSLFSGDTLFAGSCGRTDFPGSNPAKMRTSLARLAALTENYAVYPGHGPATTLDEEKRYNPYL